MFEVCFVMITVELGTMPEVLASFINPWVTLTLAMLMGFESSSLVQDVSSVRPISALLS